MAIQVGEMLAMVGVAEAKVKDLISRMDPENANAVALLEMQLSMQKFQQTTEGATGVISGAHNAIVSTLRNLGK